MPKRKEWTIADWENYVAGLNQEYYNQSQQVQRGAQNMAWLAREIRRSEQQVHLKKRQQWWRYPIYALRHRNHVKRAPAKARRFTQTPRWVRNTIQASQTFIKYAVWGFISLGIFIGLVAWLSSDSSTTTSDSTSPPPVARRMAIVTTDEDHGVKHRDKPDATTGSDGGPKEGAPVQLVQYRSQQGVDWWYELEPDGRYGYIENRFLKCNNQDCMDGILVSER